MADIYAEVTAVGIQGLSGAGATGAIDGATGATGPQGASGVSGATGVAGASGSQGNQGSTGAQGASGISGASGYVGSDGATGPQGASGVQGDRYHTTSTSTFTIGGTGTVTVTTADLDLDYSTAQTIILAYNASNHQHGRVVSYNQATGALVFTKTDASGSGTYSSWEINLDGAVGIQGASGSTGPQGVQGASGISGASGYVGSDGATGPQGIQGASGVTGASGISGASGYIGSDGASGATGYTGATGFGLVETVFTTSTTDKVVIETIDPTLYRSAKYEMQISTSSLYQATELRLLIDLPNVYLTQYGTIGDVLGSFESYYSPLSNDYTSPDINTGGVSYWNGTDVRVYTTDTDVILGLLAATAGTVFTLNSGATTFTLEEVFTEVSAGVYGAVASTTRTPTLLINRIEWAGSGDIELRFTPIYASTTLKYLRTTIAL